MREVIQVINIWEISNFLFLDLNCLESHEEYLRKEANQIKDILQEHTSNREGQEERNQESDQIEAKHVLQKWPDGLELEINNLPRDL